MRLTGSCIFAPWSSEANPKKSELKFVDFLDSITLNPEAELVKRRDVACVHLSHS